METGLKGRTVLVTGASQRMGKLAALTFAREGANLTICTSSKMKELNEVADEARALGVKAVAAQCDITNADQVSAFVNKTRDELGRIDVIVNAAGYRCETGLLETSTEQWNRAFAVNVTGPMQICRSAIPLMIEQRWGRIINLSGAVVYLANAPAKAMVKTAIVGFTRALAREFGKHNITANCIAPGGSGRVTMHDDQSIRRTAKAEEFVSLIVYLASENAGFITGQNYWIEGGAQFAGG